jgi:hypothetical protein
VIQLLAQEGVNLNAAIGTSESGSSIEGDDIFKITKG